MTSDTSLRPISPLRARMIEDMTVRGFNEHTRRDYVRHVRSFAAFIGRSPDTAQTQQRGKHSDGVRRAAGDFANMHHPVLDSFGSGSMQRPRPAWRPYGPGRPAMSSAGRPHQGVEMLNIGNGAFLDFRAALAQREPFPSASWSASL
jgi:hypothetical protein